ncbi:myeloid leukemia factor 1 [Fukomys damarensis]|uniref:myeloid leukemia factor 1 n=1 Tax=Fukomys damarensis TaxID=885580 RepID=UPI0014554E58|nr:myeloid leukemia factor 1 [Fukomys damarensis]
MTYSKIGDEAPKVFQASSETHRAPAGIKETRKAVRDSDCGLEKMAVGHHIHDHAHVTKKSKNKKTGAEEFSQEFINMSESDAHAFEDEWQNEIMKYKQGRQWHNLENTRMQSVGHENFGTRELKRSDSFLTHQENMQQRIHFSEPFGRDVLSISVGRQRAHNPTRCDDGEDSLSPPAALNPASLLPNPDLDAPLYDCKEILAQVHSTQEDLRDQPWPDAELTWYTDESSFMHNGHRVCKMTNGAHTNNEPGHRLRGNRPRAYWEMVFTEVVLQQLPQQTMQPDPSQQEVPPNTCQLHHQIQIHNRSLL